MLSTPLLIAAALAGGRPPAYMFGLEPCRTPPSADAPCILPTRFSAERVGHLLEHRKYLWWLDGDRLTMIARFDGDPWLMLCCAVATGLEPIGDSNFAAITVRIPKIREALIDVGYSSERTADSGDVIRGPDAPPAPPVADPLGGRIDRVPIASAALGETRGISVYVPPKTDPQARLPVIYLADGEVAHYAPIAEAAVRDGRAAPAILVGIVPAYGPASNCRMTPCDRRMLDYVIDQSAEAPLGDTPFGRHMRFVTDEVMPFVESHYPASRLREDRVVAGYSNGGSWALAAAEMRPDLFGNVLAMSAGTRGVQERASLLRGTRIFAGAGLFEDDFRNRLSVIARVARSAGSDVRFQVMVSGHSRLMWDVLFANGIAHLLPPRSISVAVPAE